MCDLRWQLKQQKYTSTEAGLGYRKVNREVRKKNAAKEEWTEEQCKNIERGMMSGNRKGVRSTLRALTRTQRRKSAVIEDTSRNILTESTTVLSQWTECRSGVYDCELHPDTSVLQSNQTPTQEAENLHVLRDEV